MPRVIEKPAFFRDAAVQGDEIREFIGRISSENGDVSIGILTFPEGWSEPPQRPEFDEYSVVLEGALHIDTETVGTVVVRPGQGILTPRGERVRYRTPEPGGATYLSVCLPAFSPDLTHRDPEGTSMPQTTLPDWSVESPIRFSKHPTVLQGTGMNSRQIEEFFGRFVGNSEQVSIARVLSFEGCMADFRRTDDDQYVIVLQGELRVNFKSTGAMVVRTGQAVIAERKEWFQYLTPTPGETEYFLICVPARQVDFDNYGMIAGDEVYFSE